jgi:putative peptidoglycan lipid II flippase
MAEDLVALLFERGQFGPESSRATAEALWAYVLGLPFLSGTSLAARAFFSLSDSKTPAKIAAISLAIGLALAGTLMWPLKHSGLALASSLASAINFFWLNLALAKRRGLGFKPIYAEAARYGLWAVFMGLCLWPLYYLPELANLSRLYKVLIGLIAGPAIYFGLASLCKCPRLAPIYGLIRKKTASPEKP